MESEKNLEKMSKRKKRLEALFECKKCMAMMDETFRRCWSCGTKMIGKNAILVGPL
jgi:hypothetical protein